MPDHLLWLAYAAGFGAILWVPYVAGLVATTGFPKADDYRTLPAKEVPLWVKRADRVLMNYVESFAFFAVLVLVAHFAHGGAEATLASVALWAQIFFWARIVHAIVFWLGIPYLRTVAFTVGWIAVVAIFLITVGWA